MTLAWVKEKGPGARYELAQEVGGIMGTGEFKTLKKIMDTEKYVKEVTVDNEHLVKSAERIDPSE